ncbi:MAG TPA: chemotaxis protein CheW [Chthoniobacteraceae bacterium]|jgi:chemotaxis-related protein WspD|nr:chemotaxis protein CheW [Chthoniobacteraceae bacterium]
MKPLNPCWNQVGAWGDSTCPELRRHAHCRNCAVYSQAAVDLLDRDIPEDYLEASAGHYAQVVETSTRGAASAVIFRVQDEWLALSTSVLKEICDLRTVRSLPHQRNAAVLGIVNVRGEMLVCISLAVLLSSAGSAHAGADRLARMRLLVAARNGERLVFPVDEVHGVLRFDSAQLTEAPATVARTASTYTRAMLQWKDKAVGVLDEDLLFQSLRRALP